MKKNKIIILLFLFWETASRACEACDLQQPEITRNFTHGAGPQSNWDWVIVIIITLITLFTLFYSVKYLVKPGEKSREHIKKSILNF